MHQLRTRRRVRAIRFAHCTTRSIPLSSCPSRSGPTRRGWSTYVECMATASLHLLRVKRWSSSSGCSSCTRVVSPSRAVHPRTARTWRQPQFRSFRDVSIRSARHRNAQHGTLRAARPSSGRPCAASSLTLCARHSTSLPCAGGGVRRLCSRRQTPGLRSFDGGVLSRGSANVTHASHHTL